MNEGGFEAAWLAARGRAGRGQGGGFDDAEVARRVLGASEAGAQATGGRGADRRGADGRGADGRAGALKPSAAIISVSLDDLDGDLLS